MTIELRQRAWTRRREVYIDGRWVGFYDDQLQQFFPRPVCSATEVRMIHETAKATDPEAVPCGR